MSSSQKEFAPELGERVIAAIKQLETALNSVDKKVEASVHSCLTCEHFDHQGELCKLTDPRQRPPAKIIAFGCSAWEADLPF